jgi:hypothetical protein
MGSGGIAPPFLTSELDGDELSASRPGCFTPGERASGTHWIEGWVGPRVGLDTVKEIKPLVPARNRIPAVQPVAQRYTDCATPAH